MINLWIFVLNNNLVFNLLESCLCFLFFVEQIIEKPFLYSCVLIDYALCIVNYALCIMNYALCIMNYALCIMNYALTQFLTPNWVECRWLRHRGLPFRQHPLRHLPEPLRGFLIMHCALCINAIPNSSFLIPHFSFLISNS